MTDIATICCIAWNGSKKSHQPDYDELIESYRTMLTARAEAVIAAGAVSDDVPFQAFEAAVLSGYVPESVAVAEEVASELEPPPVEVVTAAEPVIDLNDIVPFNPEPVEEAPAVPGEPVERPKPPKKGVAPIKVTPKKQPSPPKKVAKVVKKVAPKK